MLREQPKQIALLHLLSFYFDKALLEFPQIADDMCSDISIWDSFTPTVNLVFAREFP